MATNLKWWDDLVLTEEEGKWLDAYLDWHTQKISSEELHKIVADLEFNSKFKSTISE